MCACMGGGVGKVTAQTVRSLLGSVWKCNVSPWSSGQPEREVGRMVGEGAWDSSVNCLPPECSLPGEVA